MIVIINSIIFKALSKINFIRDKQIYQLIKSIAYPFFTKIFSRFFNNIIDEKLIILGCYSGRMYTDNTKYLFEFINKYTNYNAYWITKSRAILEHLKSLKYNAISLYSLRALKLLRKAKFIFMTHGIADVLPIEFSPKTTKILTWHGTPIKKININLEKSYAYSKWASFLKLSLRFDDYVDFLLTPTKEVIEHKILCSAFCISSEKILDIGYPRNDILIISDEHFKNEIKKKYKVSKAKTIFLYAPTFREDYIFRFPLSTTELQSLNRFLIDENAILLIKGHMFEKLRDMEEVERFMVIENDADIQELLLIADVLITDYSSMIFDYLLLDRPILLFTYDLEDYVKKRGIYYEIKEIAPGPLLFNGQELINAMKNIETIEREYRIKRKLIRERFNKYIDGKSTERVLKFLNINYTNNKK